VRPAGVPAPHVRWRRPLHPGRHGVRPLRRHLHAAAVPLGDVSEDGGVRGVSGVGPGLPVHPDVVRTADAAAQVPHGRDERVLRQPVAAEAVVRQHGAQQHRGSGDHGRHAAAERVRAALLLHADPDGVPPGRQEVGGQDQGHQHLRVTAHHLLHLRNRRHLHHFVPQVQKRLARPAEDHGHVDIHRPPDSESHCLWAEDQRDQEHTDETG